MLEPLYENAIEKKAEINDFVENIVRNIDKNKIRNEYIEHQFKQIEQNKNFIAIDGSFNNKKFMSYFLYAICSQAIVSSPSEGIQKEFDAGIVNTISSINARNIDKILSKRMNILELKSAIATLKKYEDIDYVLMDGSIRGTLMNINIENNLNFSVGNMAVTERLREISIKNIEKTLEKSDFNVEVIVNQNIPEVDLLISEVKEEYPEMDPIDLKRDVINYLETLEQLECIHHLLTFYKNKIICVSKTSNTKEVFDEEIPDAAIIDKLCNKSGFTIPREKQSTKLIRSSSKNIKIPINYPIHNKTFTEDLSYTVFFIKFENNSSVLKIELPYKAQKEEVIKIMEDLNSTCIAGYPYILKKAHNEVVIRRRDMNTLTTILDLHDKTGRDML